MKYITRLILIGTVFAFSNNPCLAQNDHSYPVIWTSQLKLTKLVEIPSLLTSPSYAGTKVEYSSEKGTKTADTCNEYQDLTKAGYTPVDNSQIAAESFFKSRCDPLFYLLQAKPANLSFIRQFNLLKDYKELPAAAIFPSLDDSSGPAGDLITAYPDITLSKATEPESINIISNDAGMSAAVSVLAWGDFTGDGYDDMLIFVANYATGGSYHAYTVYLLTRKSARGPLILVTTPLKSI